MRRTAALSLDMRSRSASTSSRFDTAPYLRGPRVESGSPLRGASMVRDHDVAGGTGRNFILFSDKRRYLHDSSMYLRPPAGASGDRNHGVCQLQSVREERARARCRSGGGGPCSSFGHRSSFLDSLVGSCLPLAGVLRPGIRISSGSTSVPKHVASVELPDTTYGDSVSCPLKLFHKFTTLTDELSNCSYYMYVSNLQSRLEMNGKDGVDASWRRGRPPVRQGARKGMDRTPLTFATRTRAGARHVRDAAPMHCVRRRCALSGCDTGAKARAGLRCGDFGRT